MIIRALRFHGHNSLSFVYRKGRVARSRYCSLRYVANPRRRQSRIAVVVSRKVSKSAVDRNRIRRRVYEQVRGQLPQLTAGQAYDLVFTVHDVVVATISEKELNKTIIDILQTAGLYRAEGTVENSQTV